MFDQLRLSATAVNLLDWQTAVKLPPAELQRAGGIVERMRAAGFADDKVRAVIKTVFCSDFMSRHDAERHMELAFDVWDEEHKGYLTVEEFDRDLHLMHENMTEDEVSQLLSGMDHDGDGHIDYDAFKEIMSSLATTHDGEDGRVKRLKRAAQDVALAARTLGAVEAAQLRRAELRVAGGVIRSLTREGYGTDATGAMMHVLAMPERIRPTDPHLRAAFAVFDVAGLGEAGPADDVWTQLTRLLPQDDAAVQEELEKQRQADEAAGGGGGSQPGSQPPSRAGSQPGRAGSVAGRTGSVAGRTGSVAGRTGSVASMASQPARAGSRAAAVMGPVSAPLTFEPFCRMCARFRAVLRHTGHGGASGGAGSGGGDDEPLTSVVGSMITTVAHGVAAAGALEPLELANMGVDRARSVGRLADGLAREGYSDDLVAALCRVLFVSTNPPQLKAALAALDARGDGGIDGREARRLLGLLGRLLNRGEVAARLLTRMDTEAGDAAGADDAGDDRKKGSGGGGGGGGGGAKEAEVLELVDIGEMLCELSRSDEGGGLMGESLAGLRLVDSAVTSKLSPMQMRRVGRIAHRMAREGYEPPAISLLVRVLFVSSSKLELRRCFDLLDADHSGGMHVDEFKQVLFVCGEHLQGENLDVWFDMVDEDKSGVIEFGEFCRLMRALRRAIEAGSKSGLGSLTAGIASSVQAATALESHFAATLSPLELRRAGRVISNLREAEYDGREARVIVHACFGAPSEDDLRAAFAILDHDGGGSIDGDEFREMLPLLCGEHLPFDKTESLFAQADRDKSGVIEFSEFVWLLGALSAELSGLGGRMKSVDELKADRLREEQQHGLQLRAETLKRKIDALTKASQLLHLERPLVCAQLLLRLHLVELEEAAALAAHDSAEGAQAAGAGSSTDTSGVLRGSAALLSRRADVTLKALSAMAVEERPKALKHMRQAMASMDEELPVTETAAHGVARCRGLHARADNAQLMLELLGEEKHGEALRAQLAQAEGIAVELLHVATDELHKLQAAPLQMTTGTEEQTKALGRRIVQLQRLLQLVKREQLEPARKEAADVLKLLRGDAQRVFRFATQGVYVHGEAMGEARLPTFEPAEHILGSSKFGPMWARVRALLVAAEKVAQVAHLVRDGRRRALQEGVQLIVSLEEDDMPTLFQIAKEVVRASDEAEAADAPDENDAGGGGGGGAGAGGGAAHNAPPPRIVWWHQLDQEGEDGHDAMQTMDDWVATRHLGNARLSLLKGQVQEAVQALDKLRLDFILFARSAAPL